QLYEETLRGEPGVKITVQTEDEEEVVIAEKKVKDGESIQLTVDANIQEKVYEAYGGESGTTAVIHPKTGESLALFNSPTFNPNNLIYGVTQNQSDHL